jgi:hypothetical protein
MTLIIQKPTGAKLNMRQTYIGTDDPDAAAYIAAVETADGQALETATRVAIHSFVKGCKTDGIWPAIKASCILAGARTLNGALVPLTGAAPTNFNFVSGDYNRKTGLVGDGSTKYLDTNRAVNADPQNSIHLGVFTSAIGTVGDTPNDHLCSLDVRTGLANAGVRLRSSGISGFASPLWTTGFAGASRSVDSAFSFRQAQTTNIISATSLTPETGNYGLMRRGTTGSLFGSPRIAFYSIGESLDLALLDARVTDLINAFGAAIP